MAITLTSDVPFRVAMIWEPVGGMITRMACGITIRVKECQRLNPMADAASCCPWSTERMPARMISAM